MEKTMTTKEIAAAVGKDERTARRWVESVSVKMSAIADKMSASSSTHPAQFTLAEACSIIEQGMGADVAAVFRTNAANAALQDKPRYSAAYIREVRINAGIDAAKALIAANGDLASPKPAPIQIEAPKKLPDHIARQVYAVAVKAIEKENQKRKDRGEPQLFA